LLIVHLLKLWFIALIVFYSEKEAPKGWFDFDVWFRRPWELGPGFRVRLPPLRPVGVDAFGHAQPNARGHPLARQGGFPALRRRQCRKRVPHSRTWHFLRRTPLTGLGQIGRGVVLGLRSRTRSSPGCHIAGFQPPGGRDAAGKIALAFPVFFRVFRASVSPHY